MRASSFFVEGRMKAFQCIVCADAVQAHVVVMVPHSQTESWVDVIKPCADEIICKLRDSGIYWCFSCHKQPSIVHRVQRNETHCSQTQNELSDLRTLSVIHSQVEFLCFSPDALAKMEHATVDLRSWKLRPDSLSVLFQNPLRRNLG